MASALGTGFCRTSWIDNLAKYCIQNTGFIDK